MTPRLDRDRAALLALATLGVSNVLVNRVLPERAYVPWNLALTAGLVGLARSSGVGAADLGLARDNLGRGIRTGAVAAGAVAVAYGAGLARDDATAFRDGRVTKLSAGQARFHALVRIPLGTAVAEEFAFRAVLPALLRTPGTPAWMPSAVSSLLFGLWHVLPSRDLIAANDAADRLGDRFGPCGVRVLSVVSTAAAGGVLAALGHRCGHLAGPIVLHWASNSLGLVAARVRRRTAVQV